MGSNARRKRRERERAAERERDAAATTGATDTGAASDGHEETGGEHSASGAGGAEGGGSEAESPGRVGPMNPVEIDPVALAREADAVAGVDDGEPSSEPAAPGAEPQSVAGAEPVADGEMSLEQAYEAAAPLAAKIRPVVERMAARVVPAWQLTGDECKSLADDFALVMVLWAPRADMLPPKWLALASLGMNLYAITEARRDTDGNLIPRTLASAGAGATTTGAKPANDKARPAGGFTTAA